MQVSPPSSYHTTKTFKTPATSDMGMETVQVNPNASSLSLLSPSQTESESTDIDRPSPRCPYPGAFPLTYFYSALDYNDHVGPSTTPSSANWTLEASTEAEEDDSDCIHATNTGSEQCCSTDNNDEDFIPSTVTSPVNSPPPDLTRDDDVVIFSGQVDLVTGLLMDPLSPQTPEVPVKERSPSAITLLDSPHDISSTVHDSKCSDCNYNSEFGSETDYGVYNPLPCTFSPRLRLVWSDPTFFFNPTSVFPLDQFPAVILHMIGESCTLSTLAKLARVSKQLNAVYEPFLYFRGAKVDNGWPAVWAFKNGEADVFEKLIQAGLDGDMMIESVLPKLKIREGAVPKVGVVRMGICKRWDVKPDRRPAEVWAGIFRRREGRMPKKTKPFYTAPTLEALARRVLEEELRGALELAIGSGAVSGQIAGRGLSQV